MALRFMTGFDYYNASQMGRVWPYYSNGAIQSPGRFGGQGWGWNGQSGYVRTPIPSATTVVLGVAFSMAYGDATSPFIVFSDSSTSMTSPITQVDLRITNDAAFQITRNGTVIATSATGCFVFGFWNYLEIKVVISNSVGSIQVRVNGASYLTATSLDTMYTGNNFVNMVTIQSPVSSGTMNVRIDDLYILDDSGTQNNNFLGECRIQAQYPSANGNQNNFIATGAASNWQAVDETISDDDTTYVRSGSVGNIDNYTMGSVAFTGTIFGVQVNVTQRKDDVGSRTIAPMIHSYGSDYLGSNATCQSDYTVSQQLWEKEPSNNLVWTNTSINQITAGLKIIA